MTGCLMFGRDQVNDRTGNTTAINISPSDQLSFKVDGVVLRSGAQYFECVSIRRLHRVGTLCVFCVDTPYSFGDRKVKHTGGIEQHAIYYRNKYTPGIHSFQKST